ncbi:helix-turn-helix domain-containing protein [Micrococcus lylae]|uniref:helix-turn-helix domain-containing protein n=1 Tax=Micrococcus lylae TaxID=1273 RepID=UPI003EBC1800
MSASLTAPRKSAPLAGQLTIAETAEILATSPSTVRRFIAQGELRAYRYGPRLIRIDPDDLRRFREPVTPLADLRAAGGDTQ